MTTGLSIKTLSEALVKVGDRAWGCPYWSYEAARSYRLRDKLLAALVEKGEQMTILERNYSTLKKIDALHRRMEGERQARDAMRIMQLEERVADEAAHSAALQTRLALAERVSEAALEIYPDLENAPVIAAALAEKSERLQASRRKIESKTSTSEWYIA